MYEIRNITNSPQLIRLADGTTGRVRARGVGTFDVHPKALNEYKRSGYLLVSEPQDDRQATIRKVIDGLGEDDFTKSGKPEVDAINDVLPDDAEPVTAAERDAVWAEMQD